MTDPEELLAAMEAAAPGANGTDPLIASGLAALQEGADLGAVAPCLQRFARHVWADALTRRVDRNRAIGWLKHIKVVDAAGLVDAALPLPVASAANAQGQAVAFADPTPWPDAVDGAQLLKDLQAFTARFLSLPDGASVLLAAFVLYSYAAEAFDAAPYIVAHSPAPQCGKTRLLEVIELLVRRAWRTIAPSTAVLFRVLEESTPTLLLDEAEVVQGRGDAAGDVRALLQAGYRRGAVIPRCVGEANDVRNFRVFGPKVFALIGELPAALFDRCIRVEMQRRARGERLARFYARRLEPEALALRQRARRWADDHRDALATADAPTLAFLDERAEEVWGPLVAVGQIAGGTWAAQLIGAAKALSGTRESQNLGIELLADILSVFHTARCDRLSSDDLVAALVVLEGRPWPELGRQQKPLSKAKLARLLAPFGITPTSDGGTRGYKVTYFLPVWSRYLCSEPSNCQKARDLATKWLTPAEFEGGGWNSKVSVEKPHGDSFPDGLTVQTQGGPGPEDTPEPDPEGILFAPELDADEVARAALREGA